MKVFTWKQRIIVLATTLAVIAVFGLIGYLIGQLVGNWKLVVALAVLISYPFTQFTLFKVMKRTYNAQEDKN